MKNIAHRASIILLTYNQEKFAANALNALFSQDYSPLQIVISDDASTDRTFCILKDLVDCYDGPHEVLLHKNDHNVGLAANFNESILKSDGDLILIAAGDDVSMPSRVSDTVSVFIRHPDAALVSYIDHRIDEFGNMLVSPQPTDSEVKFSLTDFLEKGPNAAIFFRMSAASRAVRRNVTDCFDPLMSECPAEDWPYILRSLYHGAVVVCDRPVVSYRVHSRQISQPSNKHKLDFELFDQQYRIDLKKAIERGLLSPALERSVLTWCADVKVKQILESKYYFRQKLDFANVKMAFKSNFFSLREKAGLIRRWIFNAHL